MRVVTLGRGLLLLCLFLVVTLCVADEKRYEVVGIGECGDCKENNFKTREAFSGLHVTIDCKFKTGETKRIGDSKLDESGEFKISLPQQIILQDEKSLKQEECYAQLHSAAAIPCPAHNGLEATKIIFKSQTNGKYTFTPTETLKFSSALCTSKFLWPYTKYPPLPKSLSWKKNWPKLTFPPLKKWPLPPPMPVYKPKPLPPPTPLYNPKPLPPPTPIYKPKPLPPPTPIYKPKPLPPPTPIYKPKPLPPPTPIYKPKPPAVYKPKPPVYEPPKKPLPPPTPVYKPKPPVYKPKPPVYQPPKKPLPPPTPVYKPKPPVVTKPLPPPFPLYPIPPFFKKPCPPFSKIPPNYFKHPKFGYFPPLPPFFPHA